MSGVEAFGGEWRVNEHTPTTIMLPSNRRISVSWHSSDRTEDDAAERCAAQIVRLHNAALSAIEGGGGATPPATPIAGDVLWLDRWADLERLAKAVLDWKPLPDTATTRAEDAALGRADSESRHKVEGAFRLAANPAAILELIAAARQQPYREG